MIRFIAILMMSLWLPFAMAEGDDSNAAANEYVGYIELKPFITNYGGVGKTHFLKCDVTIQVGTEAAHHAVNHHTAHIRHELVFLFSAQHVGELETVEAQQVLAKKALQKVQQLLVEEEGEAMVNDLFFTSFVTQ